MVGTSDSTNDPTSRTAHDAPETGAHLTTLDPAAGYVTIINTYAVAPEREETLLNMLVRSTAETLQYVPGWLCCTDQGCGRNCSSLVWGQATRTEIGRPSSSMRLSAWTATSTSVARRRSVRERSPSPITCLNRPTAASARARFV